MMKNQLGNSAVQEFGNLRQISDLQQAR